MGYAISLIRDRIFIPADKVQAANAAVVDARRIYAASTVGFVSDGSFALGKDYAGNVAAIRFLGDSAGRGEFEEFAALAPYCREGDYVEFEGVEGTYRFIVHKGRAVEQDAQLTYAPLEPPSRREIVAQVREQAEKYILSGQATITAFKDALDRNPFYAFQDGDPVIAAAAKIKVWRAVLDFLAEDDDGVKLKELRDLVLREAIRVPVKWPFEVANYIETVRRHVSANVYEYLESLGV